MDTERIRREGLRWYSLLALGNARPINSLTRLRRSNRYTADAYSMPITIARIISIASSTFFQ